MDSHSIVVASNIAQEVTGLQQEQEQEQVQVQEQDDKRIRTPLPQDVLSGRGNGKCRFHPGNKIFREWVLLRKDDYHLAGNNKERRAVIMEVVQQVQQQKPCGGRFLAKVIPLAISEGNNDYDSHVYWVELDLVGAIAKTGQALRNKRSLSVKNIETTLENVTADTAQSLTRRTKRRTPVFLRRLYNMLEDADIYGYSNIISWMPGGKSFRIDTPSVDNCTKESVIVDILKRNNFNQTKYRSFTRQLVVYNFKRIHKGCYKHDLFVRGRPDLFYNKTVEDFVQHVSGVIATSSSNTSALVDADANANANVNTNGNANENANTNANANANANDSDTDVDADVDSHAHAVATTTTTTTTIATAPMDIDDGGDSNDKNDSLLFDSSALHSAEEQREDIMSSSEAAARRRMEVDDNNNNNNDVFVAVAVVGCDGDCDGDGDGDSNVVNIKSISSSISEKNSSSSSIDDNINITRCDTLIHGKTRAITYKKTIETRTIEDSRSVTEFVVGQTETGPRPQQDHKQDDSEDNLYPSNTLININRMLFDNLESTTLVDSNDVQNYSNMPSTSAAVAEKRQHDQYLQEERNILLPTLFTNNGFEKVESGDNTGYFDFNTRSNNKSSRSSGSLNIRYNRILTKPPSSPGSSRTIENDQKFKLIRTEVISSMKIHEQKRRWRQAKKAKATTTKAGTTSTAKKETKGERVEERQDEEEEDTSNVVNDGSNNNNQNDGDKDHAVNRVALTSIEIKTEEINIPDNIPSISSIMGRSNKFVLYGGTTACGVITRVQQQQHHPQIKEEQIKQEKRHQVKEEEGEQQDDQQWNEIFEDSNNNLIDNYTTDCRENNQKSSAITSSASLRKMGGNNNNNNNIIYNNSVDDGDDSDDEVSCRSSNNNKTNNSERSNNKSDYDDVNDDSGLCRWDSTNNMVFDLQQNIYQAKRDTLMWTKYLKEFSTSLLQEKVNTSVGCGDDTTIIKSVTSNDCSNDNDDDEQKPPPYKKTKRGNNEVGSSTSSRITITTKVDAPLQIEEKIIISDCLSLCRFMHHTINCTRNPDR